EDDWTDEIANGTTGYSRCAHPIDGKPAVQAQFSYATHPWVAAPIAPMSADIAMITAQTVCRLVSKMDLTSIGLPSQQRLRCGLMDKQSCSSISISRTPGGHSSLFAFQSGTSLNSSSLVRAVMGCVLWHVC